VSLNVFVKFLVGNGVMTGKRFFRSFQAQGLLQPLITNAGRILIVDVVLRKSPIGDAQGEFPIPFLRVDHAVGIIPAMRFQLKSQILDLYLRGSILMVRMAPARVIFFVPNAGKERGSFRALLRFLLGSL
jgi:hypothetical protein